MNENQTQSNFKIFDEKLVKKYLNNASLFLLAWEMLKSVVIDNLKNFICMDWETINGKWVQIENEDYKKKVLSLDSDRFKASCLYSIQMEIVTNDDYKEILKLRDLRNEITHELEKFLLEDGLHINDKDILSMKNLIGKIDQWWIVNVEAATDPNVLALNQDKIDWDNVTSVRMIVLKYLLSSYMH